MCISIRNGVVPSETPHFFTSCCPHLPGMAGHPAWHDLLECPLLAVLLGSSYVAERIQSKGRVISLLYLVRRHVVSVCSF